MIVNRENGSRRVVVREMVSEDDVSKVQQSQREEADINILVERFTTNNEQPPQSRFAASYGDASGAVALQEAFMIREEAMDAFETLPAAVRAAVGNDPVALLRALSNKAETEQLVELGLEVVENTSVDAEPQPAAQPAEAITEPPNGGDGGAQGAGE